MTKRQNSSRSDAPRRSGGPGDRAGKRALLDRWYAAFNAREMDAWLNALDEDVDIFVDGGILHGREAALTYITGVMQYFPGVNNASRRVVAMSGDTAVLEYQLVNPTPRPAAGHPATSEEAIPWRLDGVVCEIIRLRGDRLISLHSYYSPRPTDRTPTAEVPSRAEAARIAHRQAALGRVATQVAGGGSEHDLITVINQVIADFAGVDVSVIIRFETGDTAVVVAASGLVDEPSMVGRRFALEEGIRAVRDSGRTLRFSALDRPLREAVSESDGGKHVRWSAGIPITLRGNVWGLSLLGSARDEAFADIDEGIAAFTQLISTAVANAQANDELRERAREQSELLDVAQIAASGAGLPEVFTAITRSASAVLEDAPTTLIRYVDAATADVLACQGFDAADTLVGTTIRLDQHSLAAQVQRTNAPAGVDDCSSTERGRWDQQSGFPASVGVPVTVTGQPWGMLSAAVPDGLSPSTAAERLSLLAGTGAAAIAGAQARRELLALADRQAALRRVAELAARDAPAQEVLHVVAREVSVFAGVSFGMVLRYEGDDGENRIVALHGAPDNFRVGMRAPGTGDGAVHRVWRTGRAARVENLDLMAGRWPAMAHTRGFTTSAGVPIVIRGALWGALIVVGQQKFPATIEAELTAFAELAGTAVSAADGREQLKLLADEQAAVRHVAELVARGATLDEIFHAVAAQTSCLLPDLTTLLLHYEGNDRAVVVAGPQPGTRHPLGSDRDPLDTVRRTGRPVRIGHPYAGAEAGSSKGFINDSFVAVPITVEGHVWGALAVSTDSTGSPPVPADAEELLTPFAELAAVAIANADNKTKLHASRARVIATADETRRRVQRDVHDGAQQRLVHTIIALKMARDAMTAGRPAAPLLDEALTNAELASKELRDIVRGILPASLTRGGLHSGLESLLVDLVLPVEMDIRVPRLTTHIETTAYFIVAEAMTNVVKHARANRARVDVCIDDRALVIEVRDDGIGGADARGGSGLTGLRDRIEASDGSLTVSSPPGTGTLIRATLPLADPLTSGRTTNMT